MPARAWPSAAARGAEHRAAGRAGGVPLLVDAQAEQLVGMDRALRSSPRSTRAWSRSWNCASLPAWVKDIAELLGVSGATVKATRARLKVFLTRASWPGLSAPARAWDDLRLPLLYLDDHLLAVDKPAGLAVHRIAAWSAPTRPI